MDAKTNYLAVLNHGYHNPITKEIVPDRISVGYSLVLTRKTKNSVWVGASGIHKGKSFGRFGITRALKFATEFFNLPEKSHE